MEQIVAAFDHVTKTFDGDVALQDFSLHIRDGEFLTLLGPSGCGKTTALRILAGFEEWDEGEVFLDGMSVRSVPPEKRSVNTVFQNYALFPHMTVHDNVAFGLKMAGMDRGARNRAVAESLRQVGLDGREYRRPSELSGGQQQRVAIARAIVNKPRVLLLDEPMSALDYRLRKRMQRELMELQRMLGITFILVTHDQDEAFTMSDRVAVMNHGRIEQVGPPREVYEEPANLYVAGFVGDINVLDGVVRQAGKGEIQAEVEGIPATLVTGVEFSAGEAVHVLLRPEDFRIEPQDSAPANGAGEFMNGRIGRVFYRGATYDMHVVLDNGRRILVTQFFDEDSDGDPYRRDDKVRVSWFKGWEVVLPREA